MNIDVKFSANANAELAGTETTFDTQLEEQSCKFDATSLKGDSKIAVEFAGNPAKIAAEFAGSKATFATQCEEQNCKIEATFSSLLKVSGDDEELVYLLVDETGVEHAAVLVDEPVTLTATTNDIRTGTTAVTEKGFVEGEKDIPAYHTTEGVQAIPSGKPLIIQMDGNKHQYTKLQVLICAFNSTLSKSVATQFVAINGNVYAVASDEKLATVTIDDENKQINLGITNNSEEPYVIRYFTYREED